MTQFKKCQYHKFQLHEGFKVERCGELGKELAVFKCAKGHKDKYWFCDYHLAVLNLRKASNRAELFQVFEGDRRGMQQSTTHVINDEFVERKPGE